MSEPTKRRRRSLDEIMQRMEKVRQILQKAPETPIKEACRQADLPYETYKAHAGVGVQLDAYLKVHAVSLAAQRDVLLRAAVYLESLRIGKPAKLNYAWGHEPGMNAIDSSDGD